MNCKDVEKKLIQFIDHALPFQEMNAVKLHIKTCSYCSNIAFNSGPLPDFSPLFSDDRDEGFWKEFDMTLFKKLEERKKAQLSSPRKRGSIHNFWIPAFAGMTNMGITPQKIAIAASIVILLTLPLLFIKQRSEVNYLDLPSPESQGISFSLSPVHLDSEAPKKDEILNHKPILENVDYRRDAQNGFY